MLERLIITFLAETCINYGERDKSISIAQHKDLMMGKTNGCAWCSKILLLQLCTPALGNSGTKANRSSSLLSAFGRPGTICVILRPASQLNWEKEQNICFELWICAQIITAYVDCVLIKYTFIIPHWIKKATWNASVHKFTLSLCGYQVISGEKGLFVGIVPDIVCGAALTLTPGEVR